MKNWLIRAKRVLLQRSLTVAKPNVRVHSNPWRRVFAFESLEPRLALSVAPGMAPVGSQPTGTLSGKIVFTSPGHGWEWSGALGRWAVDRPNLNSMIEDFGTQDEFTMYVDYLLRAGATVVPMRPVGRQINERVLDNELLVSPNAATGTVTFSGAWTDTTLATRWYDADYGAVTDTVPYRFAATDSTETATATYTPNIQAAGFYPVYTWVAYGANRTSQLYKINHTGGQTQVRVDHSLVGNGWVYLGTYHFNAGASASDGSVVISNVGTAGKAVIADAIRFGNGMGDLPWGSGGIGTGSISGYPREDEHSIVWLWRGIGEGVNRATFFDQVSGFTAPARMSKEMYNGAYGGAVYIGIHSNAFDGTARGAIGLYRSVSDGNATPNQSSLATFVGRQVNVDGRARDGQFEYTWSTRTTYTLSGAYGEINNTYYSGLMDSTIAEVAFHDNTQDSSLMRDPKARDQIARSLYEATLEYFVNFGTVKPANTTLPSAPTNVRAASDASGQVKVSWAAGPSSTGGYNGVYGSPATGFRIYASADGYGFDGGKFVAGGATTSVALSGYDPTIPYYFKVVAENDGGQSLASEVVAALPTGGAKQILIVNGFDRSDRGQNFIYPYAYGPPTTNRVWPRYNNSFDYDVQLMAAIQAAKPGIHVASTSNEAVISGAVNLNDYDTVIWILGTEGGASATAPVSRTFDAFEQTAVTNFTNAGGNFFVSGSDIAYDLDNLNNGRLFYQNTLGAGYSADSVGTYTATATGVGIFAGLSNIVFSNGASFSNLDGQLYNVSSADVLNAQAGSIAALAYSGATPRTAAIQKQGTGGKGNIVVFGFPFETITDSTRRSQTMGKILQFFGIPPDNADFNGDAIVDAADYVLWRSNRGLASGATHAQGDADGDGAVNDADNNIWRRQYGTSPGAGGGAAAVAIDSAAGSALASNDTSTGQGTSAPAKAAAFSTLGIQAGELRSVREEKRPLYRRTSTEIVHRDWGSLLAVLADRNVHRDAPRSDGGSAADSHFHKHGGEDIGDGSLQFANLLPIF